MNAPLVSVCCITFNHAPYIREAMDSFLAQEADFDFEIVVHDDCSTDGTADILRSYAEAHPGRVRLILQRENIYSRGERDIFRNVVFPVARGRYLAICEGDDYWTDPRKLQKQVGYMEANPDCGMSYTNFDLLFQDSGKVVRSLFSRSRRNYRKDYASPAEFVRAMGYAGVASWVLRRDALRGVCEFKSLDYTFVWFTHFLCTTRVWASMDVTCVRRLLRESVSRSRADLPKMLERQRSLLDTQMRLIDHYGLDPALKGQCRQDFYRRNLKLFVKMGLGDELQSAREALRHKNLRETLLLAYARLFI